ncbi:hypothetical protein [Planomonospora venezuelensis]|uniref:Uncharacterized protein n=1 Tax=Planomonospora venezuelensis TaxID=1999 RepID=A0A841DDB2_PLAVE|nr:hypothetical protein [Planomonospora venezuelensis]MBB5966773.1 hypothetical protein [Planomonospora venezuelensis]GIN01724.1 hypothetical protein Pve01_33820 [Planomonospora venezuelensis]
MEDEQIRPFWRVAGFAVRLTLLVLLLAGAFLVALSVTPSDRTLGEFRAALEADRVSRVVYRPQEGGVSRLVWSEGPLVWHEVPGLLTGEGPGTYPVEQFRRDIHTIPGRVVREGPERDSRGIFPNWPFLVPVAQGAWTVGVAWVLALLIMIGSVPRLGNRWAWFWLFTVGQIGAILFLLLEPRPIWRGIGRERAAGQEPSGEPEPRSRLNVRLGGGTGCLLSIAVGIVSAIAAVGLGMLMGLLLG